VQAHQRQTHEQFVLQQLGDVGSGLQRQQIFLAVGVQRRSSGFISDEAEPAVNRQWRLNRSETPLTGQRYAGVGLQMEPDIRCTTRLRLAQLTLKRPVNRFVRAAAVVRLKALGHQTRQSLHREGLAAARARARKGRHVEAAQIPGFVCIGFHHHSVKRRESTIEPQHSRPMQVPNPSRPLILASTSIYRHALLARLGLAFEVVRPEVDETPRPHEATTDLARRLALEKALAVAGRYPEALVIGSDQVADLHGQALGKPGTHERATAQLQRMRGECVLFQTAVAVVCQATGFQAVDMAVVSTRFRPLNDAEIERYLLREKPYDCAGSAKSEGLGIALLERIDNDDPTALIGLPLIRTCRLLQEAGLPVL